MTIKDKLLSTKMVLDNEYLLKYVSLIESNLDTKLEKFKTQKHHIIPRCYFKLSNKPCDNSKENLVNLLYKDHVMAHYYLCLCSKDNEFKYNNICALKYCLNHRDYKKQDFYKDERKIIEQLDCLQELYEESKITGALKSALTQKGKSRKNKGTKHIHKDGVYKMISLEELPNYLERGWLLGGRPLSLEHRKSLLQANIGKTKSQEFREHMSNIMKNKPICDSARLKISNSSCGRVWINDGEKNYFIKKECLDGYLHNGYTLGRVNLNKEKLILNNQGRRKKVICVETNIVYNSLTDAQRQTNIKSIGKCCNHRRKTAGGYHWKFI